MDTALGTEKPPDTSIQSKCPCPGSFISLSRVKSVSLVKKLVIKFLYINWHFHLPIACYPASVGWLIHISNSNSKDPRLNSLLFLFNLLHTPELSLVQGPLLLWMALPEVGLLNRAKWIQFTYDSSLSSTHNANSITKPVYHSHPSTYLHSQATNTCFFFNIILFYFFAVLY